MKRKGVILGAVALLTVLAAVGFRRLDPPQPSPTITSDKGRRELLETMWRLQDENASIYRSIRNPTMFHRYRREIATSAGRILTLIQKAKTQTWKADFHAMPREVWDRLAEDCRNESETFVKLMNRPTEPSQPEAKRAFTALTNACFRCHREFAIRH